MHDYGEEPDAPPAPDYEEPPEEGLDLGLVTPGAWREWPLWAKLRFLRRLRTEGSGRPEQYIDDSLDWYLWTLLGGRGSGKSDEASRWSAEDGLRVPRIRFAFVARTFGDVRDTMFEGETGILAVVPDFALRGGSRDRAYNRSLGELFLANGTKYKGFSSEKPNQLRGPQHHRAWLDEASSWDDADEPMIETPRGMVPAVDTTMSNLMLGLRLVASDGSGVRMVAATTPKPNPLTEFLNDHPKGVVRVLSTYSNISNLAEDVKEVVFGMYEGTDVAAQELEGRILSAAKGAAWDQTMLATARAVSPPAGGDRKAVLGVDPAVTSKDTSDETGLVVAERSTVELDDGTLDHWLGVLADRSGVVGAGAFPLEVLQVVADHEVDEVLVEVNNGFDFVTQSIITAVEADGGTVVRRARKDSSGVKSRSRVVIEFIVETADGLTFTMRPVFQSADKLTRAKAASAWWHRGRAWHAEGLDRLEKQMATFDGTGKKSPDRLDALTTAAAGLAVRRRSSGAGGASPLTASGPPPEGSPLHPVLQAASDAAPALHPLVAGYWR